MISIVVPTMWRYEPFLDFIGYCARIDVVKEVVIIDNDRSRTPQHPSLFDPKIRILNFGRNIYVNPAFNEGVRATKSEIICFLNDDLIFDLRLLFKIDDFMTPEMGAIGLGKGLAEYNQTPITTGEISFEPFTNQIAHGFGEIMFVNRSNWIDIPEGLDLGFGDNFIFERHCFDGFRNWFIVNMFHHHVGGHTMNSGAITSDKQAIYEREKTLYNTVRSKMLDRSFFNSK